VKKKADAVKLQDCSPTKVRTVQTWKGKTVQKKKTGFIKGLKGICRGDRNSQSAKKTKYNHQKMRVRFQLEKADNRPRLKQGITKLSAIKRKKAGRGVTQKGAGQGGCKTKSH